jgi:hypothetical protein
MAYEEKKLERVALLKQVADWLPINGGFTPLYGAVHETIDDLERMAESFEYCSNPSCVDGEVPTCTLDPDAGTSEKSPCPRCYGTGLVYRLDRNELVRRARSREE